MVADSDSNIAWHRVQLKKNRAELKALETARFTMGEIEAQRPDPEDDRGTQAQDRAVGARDRRSRQTHAPSTWH